MQKLDWNIFNLKKVRKGFLFKHQSNYNFYIDIIPFQFHQWCPWNLVCSACVMEHDVEGSASSTPCATSLVLASTSTLHLVTRTGCFESTCWHAIVPWSPISDFWKVRSSTEFASMLMWWNEVLWIRGRKLMKMFFNDLFITIMCMCLSMISTNERTREGYKFTGCRYNSIYFLLDNLMTD